MPLNIFIFIQQRFSGDLAVVKWELSAAALRPVVNCVADCVWLSVLQPTKWQCIGDSIDGVFIAALAHFVSLDAHQQPDVPQRHRTKV